MKKITALVIIAAFVLSFAACGNTASSESSAEAETETAEVSESADGSSEAAGTEAAEVSEEAGTETEVQGRVTAVDGNSVTIEIFSGDMMQNESGDMQDAASGMQGGDTTGNGMGDSQSTPPEKPDGDNAQTGSSGDSQSTPPEKPDGDGTQAGAGDGSQSTPPEKPDGDGTQAGGGDGSQSTPPEKPDGDGTQADAGDGSQNTPPEMPDGDAAQGATTDSSQGSAPEMPDGDAASMQTGETETIVITDTSVLYKTENESEVQADLSDIAVGSMLTVTYDGQGNITKIVISSADAAQMGGFGGDGNGSGGAMGGNGGSMGGNGGNMGGSSSSLTYSGATELTSAAEEDGESYSSDTADQSALLISTSDDVTISNADVQKTGDSDGGDNCNFYGLNAALLVKGGSTTTIVGGTVTSDAEGANGVFSYGGNGGQNGASGDGTTVVISDTVITTTGNGSGGIMTTGGGITKASNLTVTTSGRSSAAIRTDRGGGTVTVDGGTYTTNGLGSPAIYSTADITVSNADLISNLSEGVCIEGLNSIELNDCNMTANNTQCNGNATFLDTIMIYQSMSGDAASGTSTFTMNGGTLTSKNGHVFHVTNTNAVVTLKGVTIVNEDSDDVLLSVCDDGWSGGSNIAKLNAIGQILSGRILVGSNSELTLNLTEGSSFTGSISGEIENASGKTVSTEIGTVSVTLDADSTWSLTADSYITSFSGDTANITFNGYTLYVNGVAVTGTK